VSLAAAMEQKCNELGAYCICSESLDTASMASWQSSNGFETYMDPVNSEGSGAKECGNTDYSGGTPFLLATQPSTAASFTLVTPVGMPVGATVSKVLQWQTHTSNSNFGFGKWGNSIPDNTQRMCQRVYFNVDSNFSEWASCNNKLMQSIYGAQI